MSYDGIGGIGVHKVLSGEALSSLKDLEGAFVQVFADTGREIFASPLRPEFKPGKSYLIRFLMYEGDEVKP